MFKQHIITVYGETMYRSTRKLQTLNRQSASAKCKWIFLCRCLKHKVLPRSFLTRPVIQTQQAYRETRAHNMKMLKITMNEEKTRYHRYLHSIKELAKRMKETVTEEDMTAIRRIKNDREKICSRQGNNN